MWICFLTHYTKLKLKHSTDGKRSMEVPTNRRHGIQTIPGAISDYRKAVSYIRLCLQCVYLDSYGRFPHQKPAEVLRAFIGPSHPAAQTLPFSWRRWPGDSSRDATVAVLERNSGRGKTISAWDGLYSVTSRQHLRSKFKPQRVLVRGCGLNAIVAARRSHSLPVAFGKL